MVKSEDIDWSQVTDLGKASDCSIAKRLGCNRSVIERKRRSLSIPACPPSNWNRKFRINWDEVKDLGRIWDLTIAKRLNIPSATVSSARIRLGIPPYKKVITCICCGNLYEASKENTLTCSKKCHAVVQTITRNLNLDSAEGLSPSLVTAFKRTIDYQNKYVQFSSHRGIDWDNIATLGVLTDREVARQLNCAFSTVTGARNRRGIPCALKRKKEKGNGKSARN